MYLCIIIRTVPRSKSIFERAVSFWLLNTFIGSRNKICVDYDYEQFHWIRVYFVIDTINYWSSIAIIVNSNSEMWRNCEQICNVCYRPSFYRTRLQISQLAWSTVPVTLLTTLYHLTTHRRTWAVQWAFAFQFPVGQKLALCHICHGWVVKITNFIL